MRLRRIIMATMAVSLAIAPVMARAAEQGPGYVTSNPADGEKRPSAPEEVWIMFDMPLDQSSILRVVDECGRRVDDKNVVVVANRISVGIAKTPSGHYEAHWQVRAPTGALGDEIGNFHFEVTNGDPCGSGGHEGHGGEPNGKGKKHEGHGGGGGQGGGHKGGHEGSGSGGHSGSQGHSGGPTSTHTMADGSEMGDHEMNGNGHGEGHGKGQGKGNGHDGHQEPADAPARTIAAPGAPELPPVEGQAVLIALLICMMLGTAGGYVVRVNGRL